MIQFLLEQNGRYTLAEQARMAIDGGCGWIVLSGSGLNDDDLRRECESLIPICRDGDAYLTIADRPEIARDLGLHGVYITQKSGLSPKEVRTALGGEPIIGAECGSSSAVRSLEALDIDYAVLLPELSLAQCREIILEARSAGALIPIVLAFPPDPEAAAELKAGGASGVLVGKAISESSDPVEATKAFLDALS